jgi:CBS domain-containing protein
MYMPVSHIMRSKVEHCAENTHLRKIAEMVVKENMGSILVNRGEESVGLITTNDLLRAALKGLNFDTAVAKDIMSQPLDTCNCDDSLDEVLKRFEETGRTRFIVKKGDKVVGIIRKTIAERFKGFTGLYQFSGKTRSLPFRRGSGSTLS